MSIRRCLACARIFALRPQSPQQSYCPAKPCQHERKKLWQRERRQTDDTYRESQAKAQRAWMDKHPDYWKQYRCDHPEYTERNRQQQRNRNPNKNGGSIAKMDASQPPPPMTSGRYMMVPAGPDWVAKMDAWMVEITVLSKT